MPIPIYSARAGSAWRRKRWMIYWQASLIPGSIWLREKAGERLKKSEEKIIAVCSALCYTSTKGMGDHPMFTKSIRHQVLRGENRMSKKLYFVFAVLIIAAMVVPACSSKPDCSKPDVFCVGLVTDVGKVDDKSFNQSAWEGVQQAKNDLDANIKYIETTDSKDYAKNLATFADEKYD